MVANSKRADAIGMIPGGKVAKEEIAMRLLRWAHAKQLTTYVVRRQQGLVERLRYHGLESVRCRGVAVYLIEGSESIPEGARLIAACFWHGSRLAIAVGVKEFREQLPAFCASRLDIVGFQNRHSELFSCRIDFLDEDMYLYADESSVSDLKHLFPELEEV